jgi:RNA polymerase sigma-70 factor (ECF subfamily)
MNERPAKANGGDTEEAFTSGLVALIPHLRAFARMMTRDAAEADDLAQEALAKAWQSRASFTPGTNLKAWSFMILRNQFYSEKRRSWRNVELDQEAAERTLLAVSDPDSTLHLNELRMAMASLPPDQREALILVGAAGMSYEEVADICQCAVGTIKSRVSRARQLLSRLYETGEFKRDESAPSASMDFILAEIARLAGPGYLDGLAA